MRRYTGFRISLLYKPALCVWALVFFALPSLARAYGYAAYYVPYPVLGYNERVTYSVPYDNQVLHASPHDITLTFSTSVQPDKSSIRVYSPFGAQVNNGAVSGQGPRISTALPALPPGRYRVVWQTRFIRDRNNMRDSYHFTVR